MTLTYDNLKSIAHIAHAANNAYRFVLGEPLNARYDGLLPAQQDAIINAVRAVVDGQIRTPADNHAAWVTDRQRKGWAYGPAQDNAAMLHPNMLPFDELPDAQKFKDNLFMNIVKAFAQIEDAPTAALSPADEEDLQIVKDLRQKLDIAESQLADERKNILAARQLQANLNAKVIELETALNAKPEEPMKM
jgi:hypothetical protein